MRAVAVTQRVAVEPRYGERRDCLDQAWTKFLLACDLLPIPVPNNAVASQALCSGDLIEGIVLTGGNDLAAYGGDAPERDAVENALLDLADRRGLPVLGVCRGMQVIQHRFDVKLQRVEGHVAAHQTIRVDGRKVEVNSYHRFAAFESHGPLDVWAIADDGAIKAVRRADSRTVGIMWHPERMTPFGESDIKLFRQTFGVD